MGYNEGITTRATCVGHNEGDMWVTTRAAEASTVSVSLCVSITLERGQCTVKPVSTHARTHKDKQTTEGGGGEEGLIRNKPREVVS